jgi:hypothetical protein
MSLELSDPFTVFWWIAIGAGLVVTACVAVLLSLLRGLLVDVDRHVIAVSAEIEGLAENLESTVLLEGAASAIAEMGAELGHHVTILSSQETR